MRMPVATGVRLTIICVEAHRHSAKIPCESIVNFRSCFSDEAMTSCFVGDVVVNSYFVSGMDNNTALVGVTNDILGYN